MLCFDQTGCLIVYTYRILTSLVPLGLGRHKVLKIVHSTLSCGDSNVLSPAALFIYPRAHYCISAAPDTLIRKAKKIKPLCCLLSRICIENESGFVITIWLIWH